jgi:hypothetical protein
MVPFLKRLFSLRVRKQRRYKVMEGVFVVYEQSPSKNQVDSISLGGLSFYYVDSGMRIDKGSHELSVFTNNHLHVGNVPFKAVSDVETGELIFRGKKIKRQGVRFKHLSSPQKNQLKEIIRTYALK